MSFSGSVAALCSYAIITSKVELQHIALRVLMLDGALTNINVVCNLVIGVILFLLLVVQYNTINVF
jgi:hypothetical protein